MPRPTTTIRLDPDAREALAACCEALGLPASAAIRTLLKLAEPKLRALAAELGDDLALEMRWEGRGSGGLARNSCQSG